MKICFVHGVGKQARGFSDPLADLLALGEVDIEISEYVWNHQAILPTYMENRGSLHNFVAEVIMDFIYVVDNYERLHRDLPDADLYIGHSAGSVIIAGSSKPHVLMGSPVRLVQDEFLANARSGHKNLNLINPYDPIAHPINGYDNPLMPMEWYQKIIYQNPIWSHSSYWKSKWAAKQIYEFIKSI